MSTKRGRACEACSKIKIKCALGNDPDAEPPCERCVRLKKDCVLSKPQRQKDRVQELEAQVAALTRLLQAHNVLEPDVPSDGPSQSTSPLELSRDVEEQSAAQKKRKLSSSERRRPKDSDEAVYSAKNALSVLDSIVAADLQRQCLNKYLEDYLPIFPLVVPSGDQSLEEMRKDQPVLLLAIIYAASPGILCDEDQELICRGLLSELARQTIAEGIRSFELLQALQATVAWFRSPRNHQHLAAFQLIRIAVDMTTDIGLTESAIGGSFAIGYTKACLNVETATVSIACLASHRLSNTMTGLLRMPSSVAWTSYHDNCYLFAAYMSSSHIRDYFSSERMCDKVLSRMGLLDNASVLDVSTATAQSSINDCRTVILDWKMLQPAAMCRPEIAFWEHVAIVYTHEIVLHTPTNKQSFAAPFVPERLSAMDFPRVAVSDAHITSLVELRAALIAMIDIYTSLDTRTAMALPAMIWSSRAVYALYMLVKLYVAVTAPGNTYSAAMSPDTLMLQDCFDKMTVLWKRLDAIDSRSGPARLSAVAMRLQEWHENYVDSIIAPIVRAMDLANQPPDLALPAVEERSILEDSGLSSIDWDLFPSIFDNGFMTAFDDDASFDAAGVPMPGYGVSFNNALLFNNVAG